MEQFFIDFHFLRPYWLAVIPLALVLFIFIKKRHGYAQQWQQHIDKALLPKLLSDSNSQQQTWPLTGLLIAWLLGAIALAGPSWEKIQQPVHQQQDALVIVLDLSLSMLAEDTKPSRLTRAQHKIRDILNTREEGLTAIVAYSADAHVVSPLTDDNNTIANLIPALHPTMMPAFGSNPSAGIAMAINLLEQTAIKKGRLLLITDGIEASDVEKIAQQLNHQLSLSILAIGTAAGAPIPTGDGYLKDNNGHIVSPKLPRETLKTLSSSTNGRYSETSFDNTDIRFLLPKETTSLGTNSTETEQQIDQWLDRGALLCLLLLPVALLSFRRGWLLMFAFIFIGQSEPSLALEWPQLWLNDNQKGMKAYQSGDYEKASEHFNDSGWQAASHYQQGNYKKALDLYRQQAKTLTDPQAIAENLYNQANALAKSSKLDEALSHYQQALTINPTHEDAAFNKKLIEDQLENQQENDSQQNSDKESDQENSSDANDEKKPSENSEENTDQQQQDANNKDNSQQNSTDHQEDDQPETDNAEEKQSNNDKNDEQQAAQPESQQTTDTEQDQERLKQQAAQEAAEQDQATEQWLRQINDDPAGLLRRKFEYEYQLKNQQSPPNKEDQPLW